MQGGAVGQERFTPAMRSADSRDQADLSIPGAPLPRRGVQGAWEFSPQDKLGYAGGAFEERLWMEIRTSHDLVPPKPEGHWNDLINLGCPQSAGEMLVLELAV